MEDNKILHFIVIIVSDDNKLKQRFKVSTSMPLRNLGKLYGHAVGYYSLMVYHEEVLNRVRLPKTRTYFLTEGDIFLVNNIWGTKMLVLKKKNKL